LFRNTHIQTIYSAFIPPLPLILTLLLAIGCGTEGNNDAPASYASKHNDAKLGRPSKEGTKGESSANYRSRRGGVLYVDSNPMHILRLGHTINTAQSETHPCPHPDGSLLFAGMDRSGHFEYKIDFTQTRRMGGEDIFRSDPGRGIYEDARPWLDLNTDAHEVINQVISDRQYLLMGNYSENLGPAGKDAAYTSPDLFLLNRKDGSRQITHFPEPVNSLYGEYDGYMPNGETVLFASDRPGGIGSYHKKGWLWNGNLWGNTDLYVSLKKDGLWTPPINLGKLVNTPYAERSPYLSTDGRTLYLASNGHADSSLRMEIIYFRRTDTTVWTQWEGPYWMNSLSSAGDEWGPRFDAEGGLYLVRSLPIGYRSTQAAHNGDAGALETNYRSGYQVRGAPSAALRAGEQSDIFRAIPQTRSVVASLDGIYFDTDLHVPQSRSMSDLIRLADLILQNARQRYTVVGYADARGSTEHNLELSKRRADWIRNWLIDQGVPPDQITAEGKGAVSDDSKKSPTNLQKNRRVDLVCNPEK